MGGKKITYLLGAGASANALPMIKKVIDPKSDKEKGLPDQLLAFVKHCRTHWVRERTTEDGDYSKDLDFEKVLIKLENIANECIAFGTPDLYAKYLYEKSPSDEETYRLLKILMSNYFAYTQYLEISSLISNKEPAFDQRALVFLSTIFTNKKMPDNVKVITWNYDEQIEIARKKLCQEDFYTLPTWPNCPEDYKGDFSLIHLNGVAGWEYKHSATPIINEVLTYKNYSNTRNPLLSFAWETKEKESYDLFFNRRDIVLNNIIKDTDILVIIGYSFPFFNREYDKNILFQLKDDAQIYYQDPDANNKISLIIELFGIKQKIHPITFTEQYFVPFQL